MLSSIRNLKHRRVFIRSLYLLYCPTILSITESASIVASVSIKQPGIRLTDVEQRRNLFFDKIMIMYTEYVSTSKFRSNFCMVLFDFVSCYFYLSPTSYLLSLLKSVDLTSNFELLTFLPPIFFFQFPYTQFSSGFLHIEYCIHPLQK